MSKNTMFAEERQLQILSLLKKEQKLLVTDLCEQLSVTAPTIRNDLKELEDNGFLKRTHGGAIVNNKTSYEMNFSQREVKNISEKKKIARAGAKLVEDGDCIVIDSGTTMLEFAKCLVDKKKLSVITCDFKVASFLEENSDADIVFLGGEVKRGFHCTTGPSVISKLDTLCADIGFIATTGITVERGISTPDIVFAEIRRNIIKISSRIIVLGESQKVGNNSFSIVAPIKDIDLLITDDGIDPQAKNDLIAAGVEFYLA